jgi:signal transduction histidine kinase
MASREGRSGPMKSPRDTAAKAAATGRRRSGTGAQYEPASGEILALNRQLSDKVQALLGLSDDLANLMESSDVATVFLDTELRIKRFTATAAGPFNLCPSDIGRPIAQIATNLSSNHLEHDCQAILDGVASLEREVTAVDRRNYLLRLFPYRRANDQHVIWGVVITLLDVTRLKQTEQELRYAREQAGGDLRRMTLLHQVTARLAQPGGVRDLQDEIVKAAVEIAGADMGTLQTCNARGVLAITSQVGFDSTFVDHFARVDSHTDTACAAAMAARDRVIVEDVTSSPYFGDTLPVLLNAGVRALQSTPLFDRTGEFAGMLSTHYRSVRRFGQSELKWLDLLARQAADLITRRQSEEQLARINEELEHRIADRVKWLTLLHQVTRGIQDAATWDDAIHAALELICDAERWQVAFVYIPDPADPEVIVPIVGCLRDERFRPFYTLSEAQRYALRQNLPGLVFADGIVRWVSDAEELSGLAPVRRQAILDAGFVSSVSMPISFGSHIIGVLELFSDEPHTPEQTLVTLMVDLSAQIGKIIERERMTAEMADLAWREQRELLHTLHDTLGQTLTAVSVLSSALGNRLERTDATAAATARQVVEQATLALEQVRRLSRGMFPVDVESRDMMTALRELAAATGSIHKVRVDVDGDVLDARLENRVVTHLYRIAQEAVTNAVKHAMADAIRIEVKSGRGMTRLRVSDNGVGIPSNGDRHEGLGLRVMRQRAASIRATLTIRANPSGGTSVTCTLRRPPSLGGAR